MRAVARGRTIKILYFDPSRLSDTLEELRAILTPSFVGRLEGEATCDGKRTRFLILVHHGCICAAGLERDGELVKGQSALAGIATCLSRGSGILEVTELNDVGLKLDIEFNPEISLSDEVNVEEFLNHIKMKVSEATRVVEEMGRESLEPKPVEITRPAGAAEATQTQLPQEAPSSAQGAAEEAPLQALDKAIAELEAKVPAEEEGALEQVPEVDLTALGVPISPLLDESSDRIARDIHIIAPKVIISAIPVSRGKARIIDVLRNASKLSAEGSYVAIIRLNHRAYYVLLARGVVCAAIELNEVKLKAMERGEAALKKIAASGDRVVEFTLWKLSRGIDVIDEALSKCVGVAEERKEEEKALPEESEAREERERREAERRRGILGRLFRRR
ncbi:MAG: hypothetical protein GXO32_05970 [Crenarchaeota archaeon]|nr:hypothetical protein [Thermoproteota archaeon]